MIIIETKKVIKAIRKLIIDKIMQTLCDATGNYILMRKYIRLFSTCKRKKERKKETACLYVYVRDKERDKE